MENLYDPSLYLVDSPPTESDTLDMLKETSIEELIANAYDPSMYWVVTKSFNTSKSDK